MPKDKDIDNEFNELTGKNKLSKILFVISMILLVLSGITFFSKIKNIDPVSGAVLSSETPWKLVGLFFFVSIITGYISYRLAGGRNNPAIYKGKNKLEQSNITDPQEIPSYLFWAVLSTLCFIPFGLVAVFHAAQVKALVKVGAYSDALIKSKKARKWCWLSLFAGLISFLVVTIWQLSL